MMEVIRTIRSEDELAMLAQAARRGLGIRRQITPAAAV